MQSFVFSAKPVIFVRLGAYIPINKTNYPLQGVYIMRMITFTKKKIKRVAAISSMAAAAVAVAAVAVVTSVGTQAQGKLVPIYNVDRSDNKIALTFDVAWENSNTEQLIEILDEYDAEATFFITGDWCDRYPEDVKMFYDAGHEIQNHSNEHPHVEGINVNDLISDTKECSRKIEMITGETPTLYRAPYGEYDDSLITTVEGMGMKVIQWDVDSVDWKEPSPQDITNKVVGGTKSGSILLFHNDLKNTTEALPELLKQLKDKGFEFVTVSDLIYDDNYTIDANGTQTANKKASIDITADNVDAVIAQYSDEIAAAGFTDEQMAQAAEAIKNGAELPDEVLAVIADLGIEVPTDATPENIIEQSAADLNKADKKNKGEATK